MMYGQDRPGTHGADPIVPGSWLDKNQKEEATTEASQVGTSAWECSWVDRDDGEWGEPTDSSGNVWHVYSSSRNGYYIRNTQNGRKCEPCSWDVVTVGKEIDYEHQGSSARTPETHSDPNRWRTHKVFNYYCDDTTSTGGTDISRHLRTPGSTHTYVAGADKCCGGPDGDTVPPGYQVTVISGNGATQINQNHANACGVAGTLCTYNPDSNLGSDDLGECRKCPDTWTRPGRYYEQVPCQSGNYLQNGTCTPCPAGKFSDTVNATSCTNHRGICNDWEGYETTSPSATSDRICSAIF